MRITVKFFAILRERANAAEVELQVGDGATVAEMISAIGQAFPTVVKDLPRCAIAVNREYANRDVVLLDGDEIAFIPPVSGGAI